MLYFNSTNGYTDFQKRHTRRKSVNSKNKKKSVNKKQTAKTATARNKEPFLWETCFRGSDKRKFACSLWSD